MHAGNNNIYLNDFENLPSGVYLIKIKTINEDLKAKVTKVE
ncbi:MAG: hypothetical protein WAT46_13725 [Saprospiraceae bacterium]